MTRLSSKTIFLGPKDNFLKKVITKTDVPYSTVGDLRPADDPSTAIDDFKKFCGRSVVLFSSQLFKNYLVGT